MKKIHVLTASLILGLAAIFGVAAATKTTGLGAAAAQTQTGKVSNSTIAARQHKLDRVQIALRRALANRPPALPTVPPAPKVSAAPRVQRLVYTRPAPVVVVRSSASHGEHEHEQEREGGGDD